MVPGQIPIDPLCPDANLTFKAPPGTEEWCGDLHVRLACTAGGVAGFLSEWYPSPAELVLLNAGQPVRSHIVGHALPPQALWVKGLDEV